MKILKTERDHTSSFNQPFYGEKGHTAFFQRKENNKPTPVVSGTPKANKPPATAIFKKGPIIHNINVAKQQLEVNPPFYGKLHVSLNGNFEIRKQKLESPQVTIGENPQTKQQEMVLKSVPTNEASYKIELPKRGNWRVEAKKEELEKKFNLSNCKGKFGTAYFNVQGQNNNNTIIETIKTHELHHARVLEVCFNRVVGNWHSRIQKEVNNKTIFTGKDKQAAKNKVVQAIGGDAKAIQIKFINELSRFQRNFHCQDNNCISQKIIGGRVAGNCSSVNSKMINVPCKDAPHYKNFECK